MLAIAVETCCFTGRLCQGLWLAFFFPLYLERLHCIYHLVHVQEEIRSSTLYEVLFAIDGGVRKECVVFPLVVLYRQVSYEERRDWPVLANHACEMYQRPGTPREPGSYQAPIGQKTSTDLNAQTLYQKCGAEFLGTALLVYIGCGTLTGVGYLTGGAAAFRGVDLLAVSLAFGLALAILIYALGHISGGHFNPAVSIALACVRRQPWSETGAYLVSQFLGSLLGALGVAVTFGAAAARILGYGATDYNPLFVNYFTACVVEAIVTFFLVLVIMAMVNDRRAKPGWAGLMIGFTVTVGILVTGAVTGGSLNPARSFGSTIIQMAFGGAYPISHMFIYFIGPIIGGIIGAFAYEYLSGLRATEPTLYPGAEPGPGD